MRRQGGAALAFALLASSCSPESEALGSPAPSTDASMSAPSAAPPSAAVVAAPSASASPADPRPRSKRGLWIWEFGKRAPSAERAAELAASWNVGRVFIKGGNGNEQRRWAANAASANLEPFFSRGIEVWIFGYFYAPDVADADGRTWGSLEDQVEATLRTVTDRVSGFVVDAEQEFKDRPKEAERLCKLLRARLGKRSLAYTTYGWIRPNRDFPYATFDRHCGDAFLPQVYYAFGWPGGLEASLDRMERDIADLGLTAPVWPIQSNERDPSVADLQRFFDRAGPNASIFHFFPEASAQTARLAQIRF
ncbi:MAG: hypothetical protein JNL21_14170 [Myxococcales bacterium]|nr:hypothetical protein [Myxococcales bacterium]